MRPSLLTVGRSYSCNFAYSRYNYTMQVLRLPELTPIVTRYGSFSSNKDFTCFTMGNKGYSSVDGLGFAKQSLLLDFVSVTRDSVIASTKVENGDNALSMVSISAFPNPLQNTTDISLNIPSASLSKCRLMVYSSKGECVADLTEKIGRSGAATTVTYNMANLPTGVYCAILTGPFRKQTLRLVHVK